MMIDTVAALRLHLEHSEASRVFHFKRAERYREAMQDAAVLLDLEAHLGPPERQRTLRDILCLLTTALESGAM